MTRKNKIIYWISTVWLALGMLATLLKEWAYAGYFFLLTGAVYSHIAVGHPMNELIPSLLLLVLTVVSWYFRPADRKIVSVNQTK